MTTGVGTRLHGIWKGMKRRCQAPSEPACQYYGARGIKVCPEWQTFVGFLDWALVAGYGHGSSLDRIDADGNYCPENCRWTSPELNSARTALPRSGEAARQADGRITAEAIEAQRESGRPAKLYDGDGLYLHMRAGGAQSWRLKYHFEGKEKLLTFGRYPAISIAEAREWREIAQVRLKRGRDPALLKAQTAARLALRRAAAAGKNA